ncbi:hypothetical protein Tsubulata_007969 [Turnera subulata]|uniref:Bifunctional inhibitor/plant lipid transfer protein/seed storage helical domain-containing protein n=1 Tax=Turnera subulata TaxID=218843 RepID=A0A9Q0G5K2_9ROSI|nr:hypothetical protein Tsubulata_007969 [Turnera subulata]
MEPQRCMLALVLVIVVVSSEVVMLGIADSDKDKDECAQQLVGMATCLPYVQGNAKAPTPDCCTGLKEILKADKKCLCVVIKDRNDPDLGLQINVTLALGLPSVCHAPANVSQCPALLNLPPNSPDAQVFYQFGNTSNHTTTAGGPAPSPTAGGTEQGTGPSHEVAGGPQQKSGGCSDNGRRWRLGLEFASLWFLLWCSSN